MSRLVMLLISAVAGAALAFAVAFATTLVISSSGQSPVTQQIYNYGTR